MHNKIKVWALKQKNDVSECGGKRESYKMVKYMNLVWNVVSLSFQTEILNYPIPKKKMKHLDTSKWKPLRHQNNFSPFGK